MPQQMRYNVCVPSFTLPAKSYYFRCAFILFRPLFSFHPVLNWTGCAMRALSLWNTFSLDREMGEWHVLRRWQRKLAMVNPRWVRVSITYIPARPRCKWCDQWRWADEFRFARSNLPSRRTKDESKENIVSDVFTPKKTTMKTKYKHTAHTNANQKKKKCRENETDFATKEKWYYSLPFRFLLLLLPSLYFLLFFWFVCPKNLSFIRHIVYRVQRCTLPELLQAI